MTARRPLAAIVFAGALALSLVACGEPAQEAPAAPVASTPAPTAEASATPEPPTDAAAEPREGWQTFETTDGLFQWQMPPDWSVRDESFEADDDLGHVNQVTIISGIGQELAYFGSAYYGDRGGACSSGMDDSDGTVAVRIHLDEPAPLEPGRIIALTKELGDHLQFVAGYTLDDISDAESGRMWCQLYHDVPVPEGYPMPSFSTTYDESLWAVDSWEAGEAYTETQEYADLMEMFRSLELLEGA